MILLHLCAKSPDYVYKYKFSRRKANEYRCCRCRQVGEQRSTSLLLMTDDVVVGRKNPEDDHHTD